MSFLSKRTPEKTAAVDDSSFENPISGITEDFNHQLIQTTKNMETKYRNIVNNLKQKIRAESERAKLELDSKNAELEKIIKTSENQLAESKKIDFELKANERINQELQAKLGNYKQQLEKYSAKEMFQNSALQALKEELVRFEENAIEHEKRLHTHTTEYNKLKEIYDAECKKSDNLKLLVQKQNKDFEQQKKSHEAEMSRNFAEMQDDIAVLVTRIQEMTALKIKNEAISAKNKALAAEISKTSSELTTLKNTHEADQVIKVNLEKKFTEHCEKIRVMDAKLQTETSEKFSIQTIKNRLENLLKDCQKENLELTKTIEKKDKLLMKLNVEISDNEQKVENLNTKITDLEIEVRKLLSNHEKEQLAHQEEISDFENQLADANTHFDAKSEEVKKLNSAMENMNDEIAQLTTENNDLKIKNNETTSKFEQLELRFCEAKLNQHYSKEDTSVRRKLESELAEQTAKCEQASYAQSRVERKLEFLSEELKENKAILENELAIRQKFVEENQLLRTEVATLKKTNQQLQVDLLGAEEKLGKTVGKSERMKEKIKAYQKNLSDAHDEEVVTLQETISKLESKLAHQMKAWKEKSERNTKESNEYITELEKKISDLHNKTVIDTENFKSLTEKIVSLEHENKNLLEKSIDKENQEPKRKTVRTEENNLEKRKLKVDKQNVNEKAKEKKLVLRTRNRMCKTLR